MSVPAPVQWHDGRLTLLDQRLLPGRVVFEDQPDVASVARAIRDMRVRGAPAIGIAAAFGMVLAERAGADLNRSAEQLRAARPTAVNLAWAVDRMLRASAAGAISWPKRAPSTTRIAPCAKRSVASARH